MGCHWLSLCSLVSCFGLASRCSSPPIPYVCLAWLASPRYVSLRGRRVVRFGDCCAPSTEDRGWHALGCLRYTRVSQWKDTRACRFRCFKNHGVRRPFAGRACFSCSLPPPCRTALSSLPTGLLPAGPRPRPLASSPQLPTACPVSSEMSSFLPCFLTVGAARRPSPCPGRADLELGGTDTIRRWVTDFQSHSVS